MFIRCKHVEQEMSRSESQKRDEGGGKGELLLFNMAMSSMRAGEFICSGEATCRSSSPFKIRINHGGKKGQCVSESQAHFEEGCVFI